MNLRLSYDGLLPIKAGQKISGNVTLHVETKEGKGYVRANHFDFSFCGGEVTNASVKRTKARTRGAKSVYYKTLKESRTVFATKVKLLDDIIQHVLVENDGKIPDGSYELPFEVIVPADVPPSNEFTIGFGEKQSEAKIEYFLRAVFRNGDGGGDDGTVTTSSTGGGTWGDAGSDDGSKADAGTVKNITAQAFFPLPLVMDEAFAVHTPSKIVSELYKVTGIGRRGAIAYGAKVNDTQLVPGSHMLLNLAILNSSGNVTIERIRIRLQATVTVGAAGNMNQSSDKKFIIDTVFDKKHPAMQPKTLKLDETQLMQTVEQKLNSSNGTSDDDVIMIPLAIPKNSLPARHKGPLIKIKHEINIHLETSRMLHGDPEMLRMIL